ncbi:Planctomycete cytochrome C [Fuerstiella marisgermanici]|uniref:Planctomycete cytochrome C n=2 Tax=Fuerstiella marisgermanici TaxID=1891926 RepID=A0A1P8WPE6_9PLAN|nr:Planctomycete cytochrome C [Fuerstiella marisgermanici]
MITSSSLGADVDYERDIKPLLREKCAACHGALKQEAGLRLDAAKLIHKGGDSGAVIDVANAANSLLLDRVTEEDADVRMPPEGEGERLTPEQLQLVTDWINAGADAPPDEAIPTDPAEHWAYQSPVRPAVPSVENAEWQTNPIDAFIAQQHRKAKVTPAGVADEHALVRRLYFDLIGLPPNRDQVDQFVNAESDDAFSILVDELLESPHHGERWGRHWMDVWRYSDWNGYKNQLRGSQRHIWRWRDWIIESINEDKGYDRMVMEMLAGDEIAPDDLDVLRATGFLARNYHNSNRNIWLDAAVEHTAKAFLGMTVNCARCHDHKFDPIAQHDYYAMRAVFEPHNVRTERIPGQPNFVTDGVPRVFDAEPESSTFLFVRGNEKHFDKDSPVSAALPAVFNAQLNIEPVTLPPVAVFPALWPHIEAEDIGRAEAQVAAAQKQLDKSRSENADESRSVVARLRLESAQAKLNSLRARFAADKAKYANDNSQASANLAKAAAKAERTASLAKAQFELADKQAKLTVAEASDEADAAKKKAVVEKARKAVDAARKQLTTAETAAKKKDAKYTSIGKAYPATSTGRRLALAKWIADSKNPLTARVAVNHIWLRHFGEPLVANTFDFGLRSPRPEHADLLDWLAVELMEHQWSMKHIHRLIVTSRTWQLKSSADASLATANEKIDTDNRLYWRANVRRLDAEVIRDSVLHVAGSLDLKQGGADIDYADGETIPRRSVYFRHAYEKQMTMLVLFDAAGPNECYRRSESIIPQQALALANSTLSLSESRNLARSLWDEAQNGEQPETYFIQLAFKQLLARSPTDSETIACRGFLKQQATVLSSPESLTKFEGKEVALVEASGDPDLRAKENLIHVLMNHNDFVTIR